MNVFRIIFISGQWIDREMFIIVNSGGLFLHMFPLKLVLTFGNRKSNYFNKTFERKRKNKIKLSHLKLGKLQVKQNTYK